MAHILHIETSAAICSVSVACDGNLIAVINGALVNDHIAQLTTLIARVCETSKITLQQLNAIAVSAGPWSYTGLRIGVSTAKGLCHALNIPLIAVNTLVSMVEGIKDTYPEKNILLKMYLNHIVLQTASKSCLNRGSEFLQQQESQHH